MHYLRCYVSAMASVAVLKFGQRVLSRGARPVALCFSGFTRCPTWLGMRFAAVGSPLMEGGT
jgi:hypothetical protein